MELLSQTDFIEDCKIFKMELTEKNRYVTDTSLEKKSEMKEHYNEFDEMETDLIEEPEIMGMTTTEMDRNRSDVSISEISKVIKDYQ